MDEAHQLLDMLDSFENELNSGWDELGAGGDEPAPDHDRGAASAVTADADGLQSELDYEEIDDLEELEEVDELEEQAAQEDVSGEAPATPERLLDAGRLQLARPPAAMEASEEPAPMQPVAPQREPLASPAVPARPIGEDFQPVLVSYPDPEAPRAGVPMTRGNSREVLEQLFGRVGT